MTFTKYAECVVGFDFQGSRVAKCTQEIQKVFKCEASIFIFRRWEDEADSSPEGVGLWQEQAQNHKTSSAIEVFPQESKKHVMDTWIFANKAIYKPNRVIFLMTNRVIAPYLELRQSENPVHRRSDVCKVFIFFREQFRESLVSTKRTKDVFH